MRFNLIQALVVDHSHQRGVSGTAVGFHNTQAPLFLLSWCQTVAEGLPRQSQTFVGHRTSDGMLVLMELSVLHPCIAHQQAIAVCFLIGELSVQQFAILFHHTVFYHRVAGIDAIDHVDVRVARSHLNGNGFAVIGELRGRGIEPVVGLRSRLRVVQSEDDKRHVYRVVFAYSLQTMLTAL